MGNVPALVLSSAVFAAAHAHYEWEGLISVGVFGAFCGLLAWGAGSILPGIVLHAGYNALIFGNTFLIYQFELGLPDY
ncbi:MAG: CPBP family intramembrane glutamic endopeptidase [Roseibacillus sp.]